MSLHTPGSLIDGRMFVTSAGTPVRLSTNTAEITAVTIIAEKDNTGDITVGSSTVVGALATRRGVYLGPGDAASIEINQLHVIWIDSTVDTDGVTFLAEAV